jgi:hypothetical protein
VRGFFPAVIWLCCGSYEACDSSVGQSRGACAIHIYVCCSVLSACVMAGDAGKPDGRVAATVRVSCVCLSLRVTTSQW